MTDIIHNYNEHKFIVVEDEDYPRHYYGQIENNESIVFLVADDLTHAITLMHQYIENVLTTEDED